jgi:Protein of unknown function DUF262
LTSGLDTRGSAATYNLDDLVEQAWAGAIRVPHFQRDFRWKQEDVTRLFDSIIRSYPIGNLLMWIKPASGEQLRLGDLTIDAPANDQASWVVDGQQRIISLANALHPTAAVNSPFVLAYDVRNGTVTSRRAPNDPLLIPLPVVFDLQLLFKWGADHPMIGDRLNEVASVTKRLRQYQVPAYLVRHNDEKVLQDIFDRMNNTGKRLKRSEVFSALTAGTEESKDSRLTIDLIAERIDAEFGFGKIDGDAVLRAILARRGPDVERDIHLEFDDDKRKGAVDFPGEDRDTGYELGERALRRAVRFLQQDAGVPHISMLPYRFLLIVLTRVFAHFPEPGQRNIRLLRRWFWRTALVGPELFKGGSTGTTRALNGRVRSRDLSGSVQDLLAPVSVHTGFVPDLTVFKTGTAATKTVLCSWWDLGPRSLRSGEPFEQRELAEQLQGRATAADAARIIIDGSVPSPFRTWAANRILIPNEDEADEIDGRLLSQFMFTADGRWDAVLTSHSIDREALNFLDSGKTVEFLRHRQTLLSSHLDEFLARMCEWGFEDTPPLWDLFGDLEDDDGSR